MKIKRFVAAKLLAAATFGLYTFDYRKAWAEEVPMVEEPAPMVQSAELPAE